MDRFQFRINDIESAIGVRMSAYEQVLRSAVGFMNASDTVTRADWKRYVQTLRLQQFYPGIQGLGFTVRLFPNEVEDFTKKIRAEGFPEFAVWPGGTRNEYHSIVYLEPFEGRNLRAFGYDMFTEENRRKAMQRAMDTGEPALSPMLILVQETGQDVQKGCLLYLPVYKNKMNLSTVAERQAALKGFVYSPFRINDLMNGILSSGTSDVQFEIYDGKNNDAAHLFYTSHGYSGGKNKTGLSSSRDLKVAGHDWTLVFTGGPSLVSLYEASQPTIIAVAGILVNLLLLLILLKINSLNTRNRQLAEGYKVEKDRYEIVSESTSDIIWEWDILNNKVHCNKNYETVLGYPLTGSPLSYETWISHIHPDDQQRIVNKMSSFLHSGHKFWSDEYRLVKHDGSSIYILDRGRLLYDAFNEPLRMVGSMINITERRQAEETQRHFNEQLERTVQVRTMELQRSNEDLERFAHVASHDLKEPVRKILTFIDLIRMNHQAALGKDAVLLDKLAKSASRLNQLIESTLAYSKVNYEPQQAQSVNLNVVVEDVEEDLQLIISEKGAQISVGSLPLIEGSTVLLHQLFYNLLNNALKFSKAGVQPIINIQSQNFSTGVKDMVEIRVEDNGIGFSPEYAESIFQSFVRLHSKDRYEGTGLGLALCKRIVERHAGTIVAMGSPGEGACFIVRMPVKQDGGII